MSASARMSLMEATQSAVVDLQESLAFNEPFYVVVMEKESECDSQAQNDSFGLLNNQAKNNARPYRRTNGIYHFVT